MKKVKTGLSLREKQEKNPATMEIRSQFTKLYLRCAWDLDAMRRELWDAGSSIRPGSGLLPPLPTILSPVMAVFLPLLPLSPCFLRGILELPSSRYFLP